MKICVSIFVATALCAQQSQPSQQSPQAQQTPQTQPNPARPEDLCGMEGQVTNVATGAPVKKADLLLQRVDLNTNTASVQTSYTTATDAGGKFAMKGIEPGKYRLSVNRTGFVRTSYGARGPNRPGTTISLSAGQVLKDVKFQLTPHGVVTGRIVDEDGDPVAGVRVMAESYRRMEGRKQLVPSGSASTNDLGEYRIFGLPPGKYYFSATYNNQFGYEPVSRESSVKSPPEEGYVPTYYPGGIDIATAAQVEVTPGAEFRGLNITLAKTHTVRVRGHINDPSGGAKGTAMVMLTPRDGAPFAMVSGHGTDEQGNFEIRAVRPGAYTLYAQSFNAGHNLSARQALDVGSSNMDGISLTLGPGMELTGQIKAEGPRGVNLKQISVSLRPRAMDGIYMGSMPQDHAQEDGSFTLTQVSQERYDVYLSGLPDGYYVKEVRAGDQDVRDSGLDLSSGAGGPLSLTIAPGAGEIDGSVQNDQQQPAAGALVVLIPNDAKQRERRDAYRTATSDQYGKFTLKGIVPAEYKLYAWDNMESGAYMDPDVMKPFESQGVAMSIRENGKETAELKLIPGEQ